MHLKHAAGAARLARNQIPVNLQHLLRPMLIPAASARRAAAHLRHSKLSAHNPLNAHRNLKAPLIRCREPQNQGVAGGLAHIGEGLSKRTERRVGMHAHYPVIHVRRASHIKRAPGGNNLRNGAPNSINIVDVGGENGARVHEELQIGINNLVGEAQGLLLYHGGDFLPGALSDALKLQPPPDGLRRFFGAAPPEIKFLSIFSPSFSGRGGCVNYRTLRRSHSMYTPPTAPVASPTGI